MTAQLRAIIEQAKRLTPEERAELIKARNENVPPVKPALSVGLFADQPEAIDGARYRPTPLDPSWALQGLNLRLIPCEAVQVARNEVKWPEAPTRTRAQRCSAGW